MLFIPVSRLLAEAMSHLSPCIKKYIFHLARELLLQRTRKYIPEMDVIDVT